MGETSPGLTFFVSRIMITPPSCSASVWSGLSNISRLWAGHRYHSSGNPSQHRHRACTGPAGMSAFCVTLFPWRSVPASGEELESGCYDSTDNISREVRCKEPRCSRSQAHHSGSSPHAKPASRRLHNWSVSAFPSGGDGKVASAKLADGGHGGGPYPATRRRSAGLAAPSAWRFPARRLLHNDLSRSHSDSTEGGFFVYIIWVKT